MEREHGVYEGSEEFSADQVISGGDHDIHISHEGVAGDLGLVDEAEEPKVFVLEDLAACFEDGADGYELRAVVVGIDDVFLVDEFARLVALQDVVGLDDDFLLA